MVMVTIYVQCLNVEPLEKTFSSTYEDNIIIAEDLASRMVLHFIHAYHTGDDHVTTYFNTHIFGRTKKHRRWWPTVWHTTRRRKRHHLSTNLASTITSCLTESGTPKCSRLLRIMPILDNCSMRQPTNTAKLLFLKNAYTTWRISMRCCGRITITCSY